MTYQVNSLERNDYVELLELWEASVRASHDFLQESDIMYFKPLILNTYFDAVALRGVKGATGEILGFLGVADQNLEMLFVHPDAMGKGIGRCLLSYAVSELEVKKVDVNEQNPLALAFYQRFGFKVIGRSELDGTGKPYPILHLEL